MVEIRLVITPTPRLTLPAHHVFIAQLQAQLVAGTQARVLRVHAVLLDEAVDQAEVVPQDAGPIDGILDLQRAGVVGGLACFPVRAGEWTLEGVFCAEHAGAERAGAVEVEVVDVVVAVVVDGEGVGCCGGDGVEGELLAALAVVDGEGAVVLRPGDCAVPAVVGGGGHDGLDLVVGGHAGEACVGDDRGSWGEAWCCVHECRGA